MRLFRLVPSILLIGSGVGAAGYLSRPPAPDHQVSECTGAIAMIDSLSLSVRPDGGSIMTFVVDDPNSLPGGLVAGVRVNVRYETREGGGRRLVSVGLAVGATADGAPAPAATPASLPSTQAPAAVDVSAAALDVPAAALDVPAPLDLAAPLEALEAPEALPATTPPPLQASVPLRASAGLTPSALQAPAAHTTAAIAAARQCPLQLVALVLLLATGALLVISSWR